MAALTSNAGVCVVAWQCVEYPVGIRRLLVPVLVDGFKLAHLKPRAGVRLDLSGPLAAPYYLQHQRRLRTCLGLEPMWANTELGDHLHGCVARVVKIVSVNCLYSTSAKMRILLAPA